MTKSTTTVSKIATTLLACFAFSSVGHAQPAAPAQQPQAPQAQQPGMNSTQVQVQQIQAELVQIQQATLEENPELETQAEALNTLITDAMKETGADPEASNKRLQEIQQEAQDPELAQEDRQELAKEFQKIQQDMMRAQQQVMQNEEVQKKQADFQSDMIEAMQEQNPKTEELLAQLREIQTQMMQQQSGQAAPQ